MNNPDNRTGLEEDSASNLRAIFEILSYILVDAQNDRYKELEELAERIEFALNLAEKLIKRDASTAGTQDNHSDGAGSAGSFGTKEKEEILI
ncbi:hypothetical protein NBZ79_18570 [Sneathiella marina]|uniref:Uncharacterized protein n=1 Tax=Sneathiella marina TaxID=2950108 RepID=A0ABY4W2M2_9PROT|nr:hypothetical protein [Sneathiella marina]USG61164.1 hypothetical protein NBZ79_18570 [Sneathiella marina]